MYSTTVAAAKERLAAGYRIFGRLGFDLGVAGHISLRHPFEPDRFWVNRLGRNFRLVGPDDLVLIDSDGEIVEGTGPVNRSAFFIHSKIHAARPDVHAVAHAHSAHGVAWSSLGRLLDPINQNACVFFEDHALYDDYLGPVLSDVEGAAIAATLGQAKAAILRNHGLLTVGGSVDEAVFWFVAMEHVCRTQLLAESARTAPVPIPPDIARHARSVSGTAAAGRLGFQPLLEWILETGDADAYRGRGADMTTGTNGATPADATAHRPAPSRSVS